MMPELGNFLLCLAAGLALLLSVYPLWGAARQDRRLMALARPLACGLFACIGGAFLLLVHAFVVNDFTVRYVAENSNSALPVWYRVAATWGAHEGSLLLWVLLLSVWTFAVAIFSRRMPLDAVARVLAVMGMIAFGFLLFILFTSNPFSRGLPQYPIDGRDLNPLLQDIGMIFHPPILYMGYVGFSVAFAFAIASLLAGRLDTAWARWSRPWTQAAWMFLTLGIVLGSAWAYYELGWGGWWFWDPVENSSFMPWLTGTALIHSLAVTEKRGCFRIWTVLLAIITFSLSLLGTFLVRSGVLTSVHAFATDPERGLFILAFLILVIGLSFLLFAWRAPTVGLGGNFALISRESMLLVNNVLLVVAMGAVLLGTLYPLFLDALNAGKISVGPPYFDAVFGPLMLPLVFLMAVGPIARWKEADPMTLVKRLAWCFVVAIAVGIAVPLLMGAWSTWVFTGTTLAVFVMCGIVEEIRGELKFAPAGTGIFGRLTRMTRATWGMHLAHFGVAVFIIGVALVKGYQAERDVRMFESDVVHVAGYTFTFNGVSSARGANFTADRGDFTLSKDGKELQHLYPEKRKYFSSNSMPMTEAAIRHSITGDVYVSLGVPSSDGGWVVRVYSKPFVTWIWFGCIIMSVGGLLAMLDRRYRRRREKKAADAAKSNSAGAAPAV